MLPETLWNPMEDIHSSVLQHLVELFCYKSAGLYFLFLLAHFAHTCTLLSIYVELKLSTDNDHHHVSISRFIYRLLQLALM
jgi:hypothetical protein